MIKRVLALLSLSIALAVCGLVALCSGVFVLAGLGWGLVGVGVAAFVLEWRLSE